VIKRALNQKTARHLSYEAFLDLASDLGCVGVEPRNDLGRPLFDGIAPRQAGEMASSKGLRLLGLSEVYPFNDWSQERGAAVQALIQAAAESGAETVSLIPRVDGKAVDDGIRQAELRKAMRHILPMLHGTGVVALIEPIGFASSSLSDASELVEAIEDVGGTGKFRMVHDTFQHTIAGGGPLFAPYTSTIHISGISDPGPALDEKLDSQRVLVDEFDRCNTIQQIAAFIEAGYSGAFSFECTSPIVQRSATLEADIRCSFEFIEGSLQCIRA